MPPLSRTFHILLGTAIAVGHLYVMTHLSTYLPDMAIPVGPWSFGREGGGYAFVELMPLLSACCFLFAPWFSERCSPGYKYRGATMLPPALWYLFGYASLLLSLGLYALFR